MTNSQHLVRDRRQNKRDETGRGSGESEDERGEVGGRGVHEEEAKGREAGQDSPSTGSQQPSF